VQTLVNTLEPKDGIQDAHASDIRAQNYAENIPAQAKKAP